jgi:hypothetical protein
MPYAQALVDGEQIDTHATDRDLLIIATVDAWRRHLIPIKPTSQPVNILV